MNEDKELQAKHLRELLKDKRIRQYELASMAGLSAVSVSNWATGQTVMSEDNARKISELYPDYSPDYLRGASLYRSDDARAASGKDGIYHGRRFIDFTLAAADGYSGELKDGTYSITNGAASVDLTEEQLNELSRELAKYVLFRVDMILERRCW